MNAQMQLRSQVAYSKDHTDGERSVDKIKFIVKSQRFGVYDPLDVFYEDQSDMYNMVIPAKLDGYVLYYICIIYQPEKREICYENESSYFETSKWYYEEINKSEFIGDCQCYKFGFTCRQHLRDYNNRFEWRHENLYLCLMCLKLSNKCRCWAFDSSCHMDCWDEAFSTAIESKFSNNYSASYNLEKANDINEQGLETRQLEPVYDFRVRIQERTEWDDISTDIITEKRDVFTQTDLDSEPESSKSLEDRQFTTDPSRHLICENCFTTLQRAKRTFDDNTLMWDDMSELRDYDECSALKPKQIFTPCDHRTPASVLRRPDLEKVKQMEPFDSTPNPHSVPFKVPDHQSDLTPLPSEKDLMELTTKPMLHRLEFTEDMSEEQKLTERSQSVIRFCFLDANTANKIDDCLDEVEVDKILDDYEMEEERRGRSKLRFTQTD